jgi:transcriptional regulator with XRE-family HTH domain
MNEARALLQLKAWGLQKELSRRSGIINSTISYIFSEIRRATIPQAEKLEAEFIRLGIPLDRWDLMYGVRVNKDNPESLADYLERRDKNTKGE